MSEVFRGAGVALVTIFDHDGDIDPGATSKLACDLVARGIRAVLVAGTTGEAATLNGRERVTLIEAVRDAVPAGIPVIAGTGAPSSRQAAALTSEAVRAGADAVLAFPPPGSADLAGYYAAVAGAADGRPVLAYHFPRVSAPGVPVEALAGLPVAGVKDSTGDPDRLLDELANYPGATYAGRPPCSPWPGRWGQRAPSWPWPMSSRSGVWLPWPAMPMPSLTWPAATWRPSEAGWRRSRRCSPTAGAFRR